MVFAAAGIPTTLLARTRDKARLGQARVEKLAKEKLQMRTATPAITQYVTYKEPVAPVQKTQGAAASVGVTSADRPPLGARAPSGGSAAREAASVGAISQ